MTDLDIITRLYEYTGLGNIYGPYTSSQLKKDGTLRKVSYHWAITKQSDVIALGEVLKPWLGKRRKNKFDEIKEYYEEGKQFATKANGKWRGPQYEHNNDKKTVN